MCPFFISKDTYFLHYKYNVNKGHNGYIQRIYSIPRYTVSTIYVDTCVVPTHVNNVLRTTLPFYLLLSAVLTIKVLSCPTSVVAQSPRVQALCTYTVSQYDLRGVNTPHRENTHRGGNTHTGGKHTYRGGNTQPGGKQASLGGNRSPSYMPDHAAQTFCTSVPVGASPIRGRSSEPTCRLFSRPREGLSQKRGGVNIYFVPIDF